MGLASIFVLTTRTMHWFIKRGFQAADADWLPEARNQIQLGPQAVFVKKLSDLQPLCCRCINPQLQ
jgi:hypothetical protein